MIKSNKILCIVGVILIAFVCLFGIVFASQNDRVVKADSVNTNYRYTSEGFFVPTAYFNTNGNNSSVDSSQSIANYRYADLRFYLGFADTGSLQNQSIDLNSIGKFGYVYFLSNHSHYYKNYVRLSLDNDSVSNWQGSWYNSDTSNKYSFFSYKFNNINFNFNITRVIVRGFRSGAFGVNNLGSTEFVFYDSNDYALTIQIPFYALNLPSDFPLGERTYFLTTSLSDNQYYQAGKQDGLVENQQNIFDEGYQKCKDDNMQNWINYGKQQGIEQANDYTFLGLIGATIDAPISAFTSFFDFELLGVNLKDFFFAILTFALVIVIIRFALAR